MLLMTYRHGFPRLSQDGGGGVQQVLPQPSWLGCRFSYCHPPEKARSCMRRSCSIPTPWVGSSGQRRYGNPCPATHEGLRHRDRSAASLVSGRRHNGCRLHVLHATGHKLPFLKSPSRKCRGQTLIRLRRARWPVACCLWLVGKQVDCVQRVC